MIFIRIFHLHFLFIFFIFNNILSQEINNNTISIESLMKGDINFNKIPISNSAKVILSKYPKLKQLIINGGDDYELLFTGKKGLDSNKNITEIGKMKKGRNINITDFDDITNLDGYKHKF